MGSPKQAFPLRLRPQLIERIAKHAGRRGVDRGPMAELLLEEATRMADHPAIVFRDRPGGRRAGLAGHRLDVSDVIETVRNEDGSELRAADYLGLSPHLVGATVAYYAEFADDVDAEIAARVEAAEEAEQAWARRRAILTG
jgi:uncharacterized protein (DUF433 family)